MYLHEHIHVGGVPTDPLFSEKIKLLSLQDRGVNNCRYPKLFLPAGVLLKSLVPHYMLQYQDTRWMLAPKSSFCKSGKKHPFSGQMQPHTRTWQLENRLDFSLYFLGSFVQ